MATISCPADESSVSVNVKYDFFSDETSYYLSDIGVYLGQTGSYPDDAIFGSPAGQELPYASECVLSDEWYVFSMKDEHGDGICCAEGDGEYEVVGNGKTIARGGNFDDEQNTMFYLTKEDCVQIEVDITHDIREYLCCLNAIIHYSSSSC